MLITNIVPIVLRICRFVGAEVDREEAGKPHDAVPLQSVQIIPHRVEPALVCPDVHRLKHGVSRHAREAEMLKLFLDETDVHVGNRPRQPPAHLLVERTRQHRRAQHLVERERARHHRAHGDQRVGEIWQRLPGVARMQSRIHSGELS